MNYYNQTIATTTSFDNLGNITGWSVRETSYNFFDLIILLIVPIGFFWLVSLLKKLFKK